MVNWLIFGNFDPYRAAGLLVGDPWKPYEKSNLFFYPHHSYKILASSIFDLEPILGYVSVPLSLVEKDDSQ